ncbi:MAG: cytochrome P450 [Dehalococcoidia bacterium]
MVFFNPFRPGYLDDPYPVLHRLREQEPVHRSNDLDAWVVTRYADCLAVLQDDDSYSSDPTATGSSIAAEVLAKRAHAPLGQTEIMGNSDPPEHTRLRAIVNRGFAPRVIESMRATIEASVDAILEDIPAGVPFDVVSRFAEPMAVSTILHHLGIPREDFAQFRTWSLSLMRARAEGAAIAGVIEAATRAHRDMFEYLADLAERKQPSDGDVVSVLAAACDDETMRPEEMMMMLIHISLAGNGPTSMALGNAIAALASQRDAQEWLREDPAAVENAVEELLRYDSSTHFVARWARTDIKLGARTIKAGQQVHAMVGAANRDPQRFAEPDTLNLQRSDNRHLSFGYGIHFCLGAPLARLELRIAIAKFLQHYGPFRVVVGHRAPNYQLRGFQRLEVTAIPGG